MVETLAANGFKVDVDMRSIARADGQHAEWFWRREFPAAYQWLFANQPAAEPASEKAPVEKPSDSGTR